MNEPRPKRRWHQFSLRTLLLAVLVLSLPLSWFAVRTEQARKQRNAVEAIEELGGWVYYDYQWDGIGPQAPTEPSELPWVRESWGEDFFSDVTFVQLINVGATDADLQCLQGLPNIRILGLDNNQIGDAGLKHLEGLDNLQWLDLGYTRISDKGLKHLERLTSLRWLDLTRTQVTPEGVKKLQEALPACEIVY